MTTPDSGQSLESILASIRRSLAEQSTDVLDEEAPAPVEMAGDPEEMPPLPASLSQHLAGAAAAMPPNGAVKPRDEEPPQPAVEPPAEPPAPAAAAVPPAAAAPAATSPGIPAAAAAPAPSAGEKDPLWFLSHEAARSSRQETALKNGAAAPAAVAAPPAAAEARGTRPVLEPKPSRPGVVRGPLPPFFGSNAEIAKAEPPPAPPSIFSTPGAPAAASAPATGTRVAAGELLPGSAADPLTWPRAANGAASGRPAAGSLFGEARQNGAGESSAQLQALEVMVADLLRPMLRRWLDENMPRLVSAALKAEAELMSKRDPKA